MENTNLLQHGFITIQWWMRDVLKLKGNPLLAYAVVYGFSQDGETEYMGSTSYIMKWAGCSKNTARTALSELTDEQLIFKREERTNGVIFNRYRANLALLPQFEGGYQNLEGGVPKFVQGGVQNLTPVIYNSNIKGIDSSKSKKKKKKEFDPPAREDVARFMAEKLKAKKGPTPRFWAWEESLAFIEHYELADWRKKDGTKMTNWKQAAAGWINRGWSRGEWQTPHKKTVTNGKPGGSYTAPTRTHAAPFAK